MKHKDRESATAAAKDLDPRHQRAKLRSVVADLGESHPVVPRIWKVMSSLQAFEAHAVRRGWLEARED